MNGGQYGVTERDWTGTNISAKLSQCTKWWDWLTVQYYMSLAVEARHAFEGEEGREGT